MLYQWREFGNCKDLPRGLFFDYEKEEKRIVPDEAKTACQNCPVRSSCLEHALLHERFGYWANTTAGQRRKIRKDEGTTIKPVAGLFEREFMTLLAEIRA